MTVHHQTSHTASSTDWPVRAGLVLATLLAVHDVLLVTRAARRVPAVGMVMASVGIVLALIVAVLVYPKQES